MLNYESVFVSEQLTKALRFQSWRRGLTMRLIQAVCSSVEFWGSDDPNTGITLTMRRSDQTPANMMPDEIFEVYQDGDQVRIRLVQPIDRDVCSMGYT